MTSERAQAYGRVMRTLADLGPTKLQAEEQELIRGTADALLFDDPAVEQRKAALALLDRLVESERWTEERAAELRRDLDACGAAALLSA